MRWRHRLRTDTFLNLNDPDRRRLLDETLEEFVSQELVDNLTRPSIMINQVAASLMGAYASGLLAGDPELFLSQFDFAKRVHRVYMEAQLRNTPAGGSDERMKQIAADFRLAAGNLFFQFMLGLSIDDAEKVYNGAPNDLRLFAYTYLYEVVRPEMEDTTRTGGRTFDEVFPRPMGYDEFVEETRRRIEQELGTPRAPLEQK